MPRKHEAIIQSGSNIGKLKKGYRYSGKKLKNGLPQIVKVKKNIKKILYGGVIDGEDELEDKDVLQKQKTNQQNKKQQQQQMMQQSDNDQECLENDNCFSVVTHNIGPANQRWVNYNYQNLKPKYIEKDFKTNPNWINVCLVKQSQNITRDFQTYYENQKKIFKKTYDIYLLQELQQDTEGLFDFSDSDGEKTYKGYYSKTGNLPFLIDTEENLVLGNNENKESERKNHGAAVIWDTSKFDYQREIKDSKAGFRSDTRDGNRFIPRSTPWIILKRINSTNQNLYAFMSIQCPIDDTTSIKGTLTRSQLIEESIKSLDNNIIPVIGGDINKNLVEIKNTWINPRKSIEDKYKGIQKFNLIPSECETTNYNLSFKYTGTGRTKLAPDKYITEEISHPFDKCVDYFLIGCRKLSKYYLNYYNVKVNREFMAMNRTEKKEFFKNLDKKNKGLHLNGEKGLKFYDPTYEMKQDFDHASISMLIEPTENKNYKIQENNYKIEKKNRDIKLKVKVNDINVEFEEKNFKTHDKLESNEELEIKEHPVWPKIKKAKKEAEEKAEKEDELRLKNFKKIMDESIRKKRQERTPKHNNMSTPDPKKQFFRNTTQNITQQPIPIQPIPIQPIPIQPIPIQPIQQPLQAIQQPVPLISKILNINWEQQPISIIPHSFDPNNGSFAFDIQFRPGTTFRYIFIFYNNGSISISNSYPIQGGKNSKKTKKTKKTKNVRKHKGIIQTGGNAGKLKKGYKYSGKRLKNGKAEIVKSKK